MLCIPCQRIATNTKLAYLSNSHLLIKQLMLCFSIKSALFLIFSSSATLAVDSTRTFEPNTFILSVSVAVLAMRMRAFSRRFGWLTPTFFSRRKPFDESVCVCVGVMDNLLTMCTSKTTLINKWVNLEMDLYARTLTHTHSHLPPGK